MLRDCPYPNRSECDTHDWNTEGTEHLSVPDYIPQLRAGKGCHPEEGGCFVQIANWLADPTRWDDGPGVVYDTLRRYGITVNDTVDNATRRKLALLIPRVINTAQFTNWEVQAKVDVWLNTNKIHYAYWGGTHPNPHLMFSGYATAAREASERLLDWYTALLDVFDEITNRGEVADLPVEKWKSTLNPKIDRPERPTYAQTYAILDEAAQWHPSNHTPTKYTYSSGDLVSQGYLKTLPKLDVAVDFVQLENAVKGLHDKLDAMQISLSTILPIEFETDSQKLILTP